VPRSDPVKLAVCR